MNLDAVHEPWPFSCSASSLKNLNHSFKSQCSWCWDGLYVQRQLLLSLHSWCCDTAEAEEAHNGGISINHRSQVEGIWTYPSIFLEWRGWQISVTTWFTKCNVEHRVYVKAFKIIDLLMGVCIQMINPSSRKKIEIMYWKLCRFISQYFENSSFSEYK